MALKGNRPFLDRIDSIKQRFGIGAVTSQQVLAPDQGGTLTTVTLGGVSGLAGAESQFDAPVTPTISVNRQSVASAPTESYQIIIGKRLHTGGEFTLTSSNATEALDDFSSNLIVGFRQPLLRGAWPLVVNEPVESVKSDLLKEEMGLECCDPNSRQGLILQVISEYYGIKNQMALVEISKQAVESATRLYKATVAKLKVELATQLDISRAEVQLSVQQGTLNLALQTFGNRLEGMKVLLGLDTQESIELVDPVVHDLSEKLSEDDLPDFLERALMKRADLKVTKIRGVDAERKLAVARRDFLPNLDSIFSYNTLNLGGLDTIAPGNDHSWSAGVSLSYPLPLTARKINVSQSHVALQRAKRDLVEKKEAIRSQIKTGLRNVISNQERVGIVQEEIKGAEKNSGSRISVLTGGWPATSISWTRKII